MQDGAVTILPAAAQREAPPSKRAWHQAHPTIGVSVTAAQRDTIAAAAEAAGVTMGAYLLSGANRAQAAEDRLQEVEAARQGEVAELRRRLLVDGEEAEAHLKAATTAAYAQGRAEAEPAAAQELAYWRQAARALFGWRAQVDELTDEVLAYLERHEGGFWELDQHRRYVEAVHRYRIAVDRCLELAVEPLRATWPSAAPSRGYHPPPSEPGGSPEAITGGEHHGE
jgi:hypothetical protein